MVLIEVLQVAAVQVGIEIGVDVENLDDFISLGRVCEIFLNNWMNTSYGSQ